MNKIVELDAFRRAEGYCPSWEDYLRLLKAFSAIQDAKRRLLVLDVAEALADADKRAGQE